MEDKDMPAYPVLELKKMGDKFLLDCASTGISKREYFAAMAMQGLMANNFPSSFELFAVRSVSMADALLDQLNKPLPV